MSLLSSLFSSLVNAPAAIAAAFNAWMQRDKEKNTPAMQDNALAADDQALKEKFEKDNVAAHKTGDLMQVRKDGAA